MSTLTYLKIEIQVYRANQFETGFIIISFHLIMRNTYLQNGRLIQRWDYLVKKIIPYKLVYN